MLGASVLARWIVVTVALLGLGACSMFMKPPPRPMPDHGPIACTDAQVLPVIDTVMAGGWFGFAAYSLNWAISGPPPTSPGAGIANAFAMGVGIAATVTGLLTTFASVRGYLDASHCRCAKKRAAAEEL